MATITGTTGFDALEGTNLADEITGGQGNDNLWGHAGDDEIGGQSGNDWLVGGAGNDFLTGGTGNDILTGDVDDGDSDPSNDVVGADTFFFGAKSGKDTITDFDVDNDVLQITKSKTIKKISDVIKHTKQLKNGDLEINLGKGNKIVLKDVTKAEFKANADDHIQIV
jgi:Ca2+-binding RTX toxin-like protein